MLNVIPTVTTNKEAIDYIQEQMRKEFKLKTEDSNIGNEGQ